MLGQKIRVLNHSASRDFTPGLSDFGLRRHDSAFFLRASDFIPLPMIPRTELAVGNATGAATFEIDDWNQMAFDFRRMANTSSKGISPLQCAREEWEAKTERHPKQHLIGKTTFIDEFRQLGKAIAWLDWGGDCIEIKKLETLQPNGGGPTLLIEFLKILADKHHVLLWGHARVYPLDPPIPEGQLLTKVELEAFYKRRGFHLREIDTKTSEMWYPSKSGGVSR